MPKAELSEGRIAELYEHCQRQRHARYTAPATDALAETTLALIDSRKRALELLREAYLRLPRTDANRVLIVECLTFLEEQP